MKITQQTSTQLIAQNSPLGAWLSCGILFMIGASALALPINSLDDHLGAYFYASVFIGLSVLTFLTDGQSVTWTFDKVSNSVLVRSRSFGVRKTIAYPLTAISTVQVNSRATGEGESTFGVELVLLDGERLQLCPGFTLSDLTAKEAVNRISNFLKLHQPSQQSEG